ncbi:MAG: hypothetical protein IKP79_02080 [Bacilli bacterium]|nr:hypothetical protein [Bacilli bacterium]
MSDNYRVTPVTANGNIDLSIINQNPDVVGNKIVETVDLSIPTYTIPETGSLNKENIDFSRISGTSSGVADNNFIGENRIAKDAWGDNGGLNYQIRKDGTVAIKEGDEIIGFTDQKGLQNSLYSKQAPDKVNIASINQNRDVASYGKEIPNNNTVGGQNLADINHRTDIKANTQAPNLASVNQNPDVRGYGKEIPSNNNTVGGQNLARINRNPNVVGYGNASSPNTNTVGGQNLADINHRTDIKANTQAPNLASVNQNPDVRGYGKEVPNNNNTVGGQNLADINHNPSVSNKIPTETYAASNQPSTPQAIPEDFDFKHEQSNILAAKARNMGFTDDQIKMAIGVSRWETGNYEHLAYGYNYGGVTGKGDLGNEGGYAKFSTQDKGMDAFLQNLKKNYFDQGMNEIDGKFARKYVGDYSSDHLSSWVKGVKGCMS